MIKRVERISVFFPQKIYVFKILLEYSNPKGNSSPKSLKQRVILEGCENPSEFEEKAIKEKTPLYNFSREWNESIENFAYVNLRNIRLLESVRRYPANYLHPKIPVPYEQRLPD